MGLQFRLSRDTSTHAQVGGAGLIVTFRKGMLRHSDSILAGSTAEIGANCKLRFIAIAIGIGIGFQRRDGMSYIGTIRSARSKVGKSTYFISQLGRVEI
ncbi:unnamed protein product [Protopolystoma xenopodis]|uniref:Uncharacterized protein n=1 Tax=Protopolystoma xenopodis TaxID=117903 RepID=A0A448WKY9_9PLAT|nr:unnamed protein product [Protopolystoma xenopodis]